MSLLSASCGRYIHRARSFLTLLVALTALSSLVKPACAIQSRVRTWSLVDTRIPRANDRSEMRATDGHRTGFVLSLGYGPLSVESIDSGTSETWSMIAVAIGFSKRSGDFQLLMEGMISPSRTRHVPYNGWVPAHNVTKHYRGGLLRTRFRLFWKVYGALGVGIIDSAVSRDVGLIRSSSVVTGDWTWGGDVKVLYSGSVGLFLGIQVHNFFAGEGDTRPDYNLTTFHATVLIQ